MKKRNNNVRLSAGLKPIRYRIMVKPDLKNFIFSGEETVYLNVVEPTKVIVLHSKDLVVSNVLVRQSRLSYMPKSVSYDDVAETLIIKFDQALVSGKAELDLHFEGKILEGMRGLYRSKYTVGGEDRYLMTSQFEATDARRAFPCVDEPAAKAIFDVTLMVPKGMMAVSNTLPSVVKEHESGYQLVEFESTPKMSTYLLAMIVGEFEFLETKTKEGVLVRVFTTPGKKHQAKFALETASKMLSFYNEYFGINYPLPVLDMIAVPDFESGAMENWGAVTYRETAILVDEEHTSTNTKQWTAMVIAHELAHQWFGNLVTMEWWTHLWLNEGFASYIEYLAVDHLFPEWKIWEQFVAADLSRALELDGLENTHAIEIPVSHPREIGEIFDAVSYSKGAAVIRMLAEYLGEKDFQRGLSRYLKKHSYGNASTEDLWSAFEVVSKKPVRMMMINWTKQPGYPVVTIHEKSGGFFLSQERFFSSVNHGKAKPQLWKVPVNFQTLGDKSKYVLFDKKEIKLASTIAPTTKFNLNATGVYRVDYPAKMLHALGKSVADGFLNTSERFALINNAFALSEAGKLSMREVLILLDYFRDEKEFVVWNAIVAGMTKLNYLLYDQKNYVDFKKFCVKLFGPIASWMGFEKKVGDSHVDNMLRGTVIYQAGKYGDESVIKKARELFKKIVAGDAALDIDVRAAVYFLVAENGGKNEYDQIHKLYLSATLNEERVRLGRALMSFNKESLILKSLKFALSKDVRLQDAPSFLARSFALPGSRLLAWEFFKTNWLELVKRYEGGHSVGHLVGLLEFFVHDKDAKDIERFFKNSPYPGGERALKQSLEKIRSNSLWVKRDAKVAGKWLEGNLKIPGRARDDAD